MIIGNNNQNSMNKAPSFHSDFEKRFNTVVEANKNNNGRVNPYQIDQTAKHFSDPTNKDRMADKAFAMLQERLQNGTITLKEFHKKCEQLQRFRG